MVWLATKGTTCAKAALPRRAPSPVHNNRRVLTGVHLMGVHLIDVYFMDVYMFPNPKRLWRNLQVPHLTNGGRFVEI
jgi:hypothetical protein